MSYKKDKKIEQRYQLDDCYLSPTDPRDYTTETVALTATPLPDKYIVKHKLKILDQGSIGSCVAHALATALAYGEQKSINNHPHDYSRGFIYANRSLLDHQKEGMFPRQALKHLNHEGDCEYITFPWNETYPKVKERLEDNREKYMQAAEHYKILNYFRLYTNDDIKQALYDQGAVIISIPIYTSFCGDTKMPTDQDKLRGRHCMCLIGWDETGWIVQNSWSAAWGKHGCLHLPYDYPSMESWGITVDNTLPKPQKNSWLQKILNSIIAFFKKLFHTEK